MDHQSSQPSGASESTPSSETNAEAEAAQKIVQPLEPMQRRILGVLIEKARTTPDAYPLSLNALVNGCNQKSNRYPLMSLTSEQVEDELQKMREQGVLAEVHGGGRVPKYRHYGSDYMGTKGIETGVMAELLLRGEQTAGELRTRASRFGAIDDLGAMQNILNDLIGRNLVVALTPPGRGQLFTHNLYQPHEMQRLKEEACKAPPPGSSSTGSARSSTAGELSELKSEVDALKATVADLVARMEKLEG